MEDIVSEIELSSVAERGSCHLFRGGQTHRTHLGCLRGILLTHGRLDTRWTQDAGQPADWPITTAPPLDHTLRRLRVAECLRVPVGLTATRRTVRTDGQMTLPVGKHTG